MLAKPTNMIISFSFVNLHLKSDTVSNIEIRLSLDKSNSNNWHFTLMDKKYKGCCLSSRSPYTHKSKSELNKINMQEII